MKTDKFFRFLTLAMCAIAFAFVTGCEGPEGPVGPKGDKGDTGDTGATGAEGPQGVAGNVTCLECHGDETIQIVKEGFHQSQHASGAIAVDYAGGRASCAECHSHEGYLEFARTGDVANDIVNPSAWQCKTCHNIHTTFEQTDFAFRLGGAVSLKSDDYVFDSGNNNTCANCHQARRGYAYYDGADADKTYVRKFTDADDIALYQAHGAVGPTGSKVLDTSGATDTLVVTFDVPVATHAYISSTHAGPHHGPQTNMFVGLTGAGVADGVTFEAHSGGCVVCHMGPESGHSFIPDQGDFGNCQVDGCHSASKEGSLDAFETRVVAVGMALELEGAVHFDAAGYADTKEYWGNFHPMYASLDREIFQAWWNFMYLLEDRSNSAHNPTYAHTVLEQAETALGL